MCETHQEFLFFLQDCLSETASLQELNELEKHALLRKEIYRKTHSVCVPRLGSIVVMKKCCKKASCVATYEIQNLRSVQKCDAFPQTPDIALPAIEETTLAKKLKERTKLRALQESKTSKVPYSGQWILARLFRVLDGDTLLLGLVLGDATLKISLRVLGVDCPETKKASALEMQAGEKAKEYVQKLYAGESILAIKLMSVDKWGARWVGYAQVPTKTKGKCKCACGATGSCLSTLLLEKGLAKAYQGAKKEPWTEQELKKIIGH